MRIGIHGKPFEAKYSAAIRALLEEVQQQATLQVSSKFARQLTHHEILPNKVKQFDLNDPTIELDAFFSLGGDGTILESVAYIGPREVPVLGINLGRLGFLADTSNDHMLEAIQSFFREDYTVEERMMIDLSVNKNLFSNRNFALNDFTILKKDSSSMIVVHVYINDEFLNSYWSDGIILATPTGSTGYSLSCGGPIMLPNSNNFVITPVSPHNLTARPMVVSADSKITFRIEGRQKNFLVSLDSRYRTVDASVNLEITKADFNARMIRLKGMSYLDTLRQKLNWGRDIRNW